MQNQSTCNDFFDVIQAFLSSNVFVAFEDISLNLETHFKSLNFEFESSIYNCFSEDCASKDFGRDYYENYEFRVLIRV